VTEKLLKDCTMDDILRLDAIRIPTGQRYRRNGATRRWKTSSTRFRVPLKYGLYVYGALTDADIRVNFFHPDAIAEISDRPHRVRYS
jgi:hypothetical protein